MVFIAALKGAGWRAEPPTERIVLAVDLYDSTRRRLQDANEQGDPLKRLESYASRFLRHNAIIYELYEELGGSLGARLIDFVSDAAVFTLDRHANKDAMIFALRIVETLGDQGLDTSVGIDCGLIATFSLVDSGGAATRFEQVVGKAVDRAVRLSWIARPGEVLAVSEVADAQNLHSSFQFDPPKSAVKVSLDKWDFVDPEDFGVFSVYARDRTPFPGAPGNLRKFSRYLLELQTEMHGIKVKEGRMWPTNVADLDDEDMVVKITTADLMLGYLGSIVATVEQRPAELRLTPYGELAAKIAELSRWCSDVCSKLEEFKSLVNRTGRATWKEVGGGDPADFARGLSLVILASRSALVTATKTTARQKGDRIGG